MTAQGEDILAWLDRAITEREQIAQAASHYGSSWTVGMPERHKDRNLRYAWDADMVYLSQDDPHIAYQCLSDEIAALTVAHDPASVLRRCVADRKLIAEHGPFSATDLSCKGCGLDNCEEMVTGYYEDCPVLCALAEGYGWTEGER